MDTLSSPKAPSRAVIIGGGLAGMVAANELLKQKIPVLLLERERRTGGKAGADLINGVFEEHGYHVFPTFYANTLALIDEIGASNNLVPITKFHYLLAPDTKPKQGRGVYPNSIVFLQPDSISAAVKDTFSGIIPWYEFILFFYAMIDLCSQPNKSRRFLDQVSVTGFIRSRWYRSDIIADFHQQTVLQASAIPSYDLSAMTMKHLVQHWCGKLKPLFRILNGNLQQKFIEPLEKEIRRNGCEIKFNTSVTEILTDGEKLCGLKLESADSATIAVERLNPSDICIIATPHEVTSTFFNDSVCQCDDRSVAHPDTHSLGFVNNLESAPMAAFQFYLNRKIPALPPQHVNLFESKFGLSFIDVSQTWQGLPNTTLSVIASDFRSLRGISDDEARDHIFKELQRFVPELKERDIERVHPEQNIRTPLFLNTVGAWHFRPATRTRIKNLYIAGDYCRTRADLTTMESAVISGRQTAASVLEDAGLDPTPAKPIRLSRPYWRFKFYKWAGLPFALLLRGIVLLSALIKDLVTGNFSLRKWLD
jgi:uncharacterized protein with NAD-binding domain and iron-sulfur cluster